MSWSQFKDEVGDKMKAASWKTADEFAIFFTKKYDEAMKRGKDATTGNPVLKGNTELMQQLIINAGNVALVAKTPAFYNSYLKLLGLAVVGYWTGATLQKTNTPIRPAVGTILNLSVTDNLVTTPGKFGSGYTPPIKEVDIFLDNFIMLAKIHLQTIQGVCYTISQYIPPMPIGPAIINWSVYIVEPGQSNSIKAAPLFEFNNADFKLTKEEEEGAKEDIKQADAVIEKYTPAAAAEQNNKSEVPLEDQEEYHGGPATRIIETAREMKALATEKLATGMNVSKGVDPAALNNIQQSTKDDDVGKRIVAYAKAAASIPVMETPPKSNYGGYVTTYLNGTGINGPAFWCAAAVSYWFKQAGAKSPNSAGCAAWKAWAIKNGLWSSTPVIGAAIIYANGVGHPHHIGIVTDPKPNSQGRITSIEGNTTGGGFNRDGVGVFLKNPRLASINGFIIPKKK